MTDNLREKIVDILCEYDTASGGAKLAAAEVATFIAQDRVLLEAENARLREALEQIAGWGDAYPLDIFREPDFKRAHELLQAGGMTIGAISASIARRLAQIFVSIARAALSR